MYGFFAALMLGAFIASIALTVIGYKRYINDTAALRINPRDQRTWGPFLNFDTLIIDKVLKALYLFNAIFLALGGIVGILSLLAQCFGAFVAGLIGGAIAIVLLELLLRLSYELIMMTIVIARNTSAIKRKLCNDEIADADGISSLTPDPVPAPAYAPEAAPAPAYFAPEPVVAPAPAPVAEPVADAPAPEPVVEAAPEPAAEPEPVVEPEAPAAPVCPVCGAPISPDDKFCAVCGAKLS